MPSEITPTVEQSKIKFTRLLGVRNIGLSDGKNGPDDDEADDNRAASPDRRPARGRKKALHRAADACGVGDPAVGCGREACARRNAGRPGFASFPFISAPPGTHGAFGGDALPARRETALSVAPVIAPTSSSIGRVAGVYTPLFSPEPQDHDPVGHGAHIFHVVRDHDDAQPPVAYTLDEVQDLGGLGDAEGGGRLVQHDDLGFEQQRTRDRDRLALSARQRGHDVADAGNPCGEFVEQGPGAHLHRHFVEVPGVAFLAEKDVGHHIQILTQCEILKYRCNAQIQRVAGAVHRDRPALEADAAGCRLMHAGQYLDEGRFSRAVVAHKGNHLACVNIKFYVGQRRYGAEILGDAGKAQDRLCSWSGHHWTMDRSCVRPPQSCIVLLGPPGSIAHKPGRPASEHHII